MKNNRILATFVTYKNLYRDKTTDVYDIISEFARYVIIKEHKTSFSQILFPSLIEKYFDFQIPTLVLKPAVKRIEGVSLENKEYKVNYNLVETHNDFDNLQCVALSKTDRIISDLISYISKKTSTNELTNEFTNEITIAFRKYILDESTNGPYDALISAFIMEMSTNAEYTNDLNQIREGHILYNGLCQNNEIIAQGWKDELTIYLDTEILFHIAGYNGVTFQQLANEFLNLVSIANEHKNLIRLKYFSDTQNEIDKFFSTAETLYNNNSVIRPGETAMISILSDCHSVIDIENKKTSLLYMLNKMHIYLENKNDFYAEKYNEFNLETKESIGTPNEKSIRLLSHINKLRGHNISSDYSKSIAILVSETGSALEFSRSFTKEKAEQNKHANNIEITSLAVNLYSITNILWYRLNRSLRDRTTPSTIDAVIRAQIILSKYINESITTEYDKIMKDYKNGIIEKEEIAALVLGMRQRSSKPETIIKEGVDDALNLICEKDINRFKEDYELERHAHNELEESYNRTLEQLAATKEDVEFWKQKNKEQQKLDQIALEKIKLENLQEWLSSSTSAFNKEEENLKHSIKIKKLFIICTYIVYYIIIVGCICRFGWNVMEPITYIVGIPPIAIPFILNLVNCKYTLNTWIKSYQKNKNYLTANEKYNEYRDKVTKQEIFISELYQE